MPHFLNKKAVDSHRPAFIIINRRLLKGSCSFNMHVTNSHTDRPEQVLKG